MNFRQIVRQFIFHSIILTVLLFVSFNARGNGDMNVVIFGTFLYLPYVLMLTGLNLFLISLGLKILNKRPYVFLISLFTSIVLITWLLLSDGQIEVRYWKFTLTEFVTLNFVILTLNMTLIRLTTKQIKNETN